MDVAGQVPTPVVELVGGDEVESDSGLTGFQGQLLVVAAKRPRGDLVLVELPVNGSWHSGGRHPRCANGDGAP